MDINDLRGLSTVLMLCSFLGLCVWAYSSARKKEFEEAASLPFTDEHTATTKSQETHND
jgi:cytochrome c oxidase cbb3-type subunit 4